MIINYNDNKSKNKHKINSDCSANYNNNYYHNNSSIRNKTTIQKTIMRSAADISKRQTHKAKAKQNKTVLSLRLRLNLCLPALLLLFTFCMLSQNEVDAGTQTQPPADFCAYKTHNDTVIKEIGAVWFNDSSPCLIYSCAAGVLEPKSSVLPATPRIIETTVDCGDIYCEVDAELRATEGSCCGECVRTRCRYNDSVYEIGQTWHNDADCTLLECVRLPTNGMPMINAYQRTCPPLPENCPPANVYTENCCQQCRTPLDSRQSEFDAELAADGIETHGDIWTPEFYRQHPCVRDCQANAPPMTCHYTFVVEWYQTLSKACYDCPHNLTDCARPHCIAADGLSRSITVVNRMLPGPSIEVCENDIIVADVINNMLGESTTMHWHGLHQRETPYMDGVPHITQCPISPHASFRYTFKANNVGTHFWHSHTGMQRGDGMFGALIIRQPKAADPHGGLYDFDLSEHMMLVQDWVHVPGVSIFADHHHSRGDNKPRTLLVNGRGRFYNHIWDLAKQEAAKAKSAIAATRSASKTTTSTTTSTTTTTTKAPASPNAEPEAELFQTGLDEVARLRFKDADHNELSRLARLVKQATKLQPVNETFAAKPTTEPPPPPPTHTRRKRANIAEPDLNTLPHEVYHVRRGFRYRFRVINAEFLNCPIVVSVDNHTLTAINSDGYDFEPLEVGGIVTYAGERFDFVLNANQPVGNYWVRLKGLMDCSEVFTSAFQVAILRYEGAPVAEPGAELSWAHTAPGIELNVMNRGPGHADTKTVAELKALPAYNRVPGIDLDALKPEADYKFFVYYDFYVKDNPEFHPTGLYGIDANLTRENKLFTPQLNHISLKFPSVALLPARDQIDDSLFCNETSLAAQGIDCRKQFCKCHHVLQVPLNAIVEFIIVDEGMTFYANHPFHLHGNAFRVVGLERLGENVTIEMIKQLDSYNLLKRNLVDPPVKDTVTVPDGGYTIIRFEAYNPGFWLFHCHIEFHAEIGMALVLKVGDNAEMPPVPKNFPTCNDYMPDMHEGSESDTANGASKPTTTSSPSAAPINPSGNHAASYSRESIFVLMLHAISLLVLRKYLQS